MSTDRDKALDMALAQIDKQYGKGSIMRMGEKTTMAIESISTGALSLDLALGIGGLPRGRVTEIYGPESSGKSTLAMHVVAEAQRNGGVCAYIDAEHAMDPVYANAIGVDIDQLLISQPDTGEQALEICDMLVRSGAIDVIVIDSVAALTPRARSSANAPVGMASMAMVVFSPIRMIEPLPNCLSIWPSAISSALSRSTVDPSLLVRLLVGGSNW